MAKFLIIYSRIKDRLPLIEQNIDQKFIAENKINDDILDAELTQKENPSPAPKLLFGFISIITILFWHLHQMNDSSLQSFINNNRELKLAIFSSGVYYFQIIAGGISILVSIMIIIIFNIRGVGSTILNFCMAMILIGIAGLMSTNLASFGVDSLAIIITSTVIVYSLAEVLISPFAYSYITRICKIEQSSSMVGGFMFLSGLGVHLFYYIFNYFSSTFLMNIMAGITILVGGLIFYYRKKLWIMSGGID